MPSSPSKKETKLSPEMERRLAAIRRSNPTCADCPAKKPQWVSFLLPLPCSDGIPRELGALCCLNCVQHHHFELGNERCTIKSLAMAHEWILDDIKVLEYSGNSFVNSILEANVVDFDKNLVIAPEEKEDKRRARFIKYKYKQHRYLDDVIYCKKSTPPPQSDELDQGFTDKLKENNTLRAGHCDKNKNEFRNFQLGVRAHMKMQNEDRRLSTTDRRNRRRNLRRGNIEKILGTQPNNKEGETANNLTASDHPTRAGSLPTTDSGNRRRNRSRRNSTKILGTSLPITNGGNRRRNLRRANNANGTDPGNRRKTLCRGNSPVRALGQKINKPRGVIEDEKKKRGEEHQTYLKTMEGEEAKKIVDSPPYNNREGETANELTASAVDQVTRTCSQPTTDRGNRGRKLHNSTSALRGRICRDNGPTVVALPKLETRIRRLGAVRTMKQCTSSAA